MRSSTRNGNTGFARRPSASTFGDRRFDALWDDVSLAAVARNEAHTRELLGNIDRISRDALSAEDGLSLELFRYQTGMTVEVSAFGSICSRSTNAAASRPPTSWPTRSPSTRRRTSKTGMHDFVRFRPMPIRRSPF